MEVLIFKTNIIEDAQVSLVRDLLKETADIKQFNVDRDDCDRVLRIVGASIHPRDVESLLQDAGFECSELVD